MPFTDTLARLTQPADQPPRPSPPHAAEGKPAASRPAAEPTLGGTPASRPASDPKRARHASPSPINRTGKDR